MIYYGDDFIKEFVKESSCVAYSRKHPKRLCYCKSLKKMFVGGQVVGGGGGLSGNSSESNEILRMDEETLKLYAGNTPITQILDSQSGAVGGYLWSSMNTDNALMTALNYKNDRTKLQEKVMVTPVNLTFFPTSVNLYADTYNDFINGVISTYTFTLPTAPTDSYVHSIIVHFTTGASPSLTINGNGKSVSYFDNYVIKANTEYELNIMWNGTKWIVAYGVIN